MLKVFISNNCPKCKVVKEALKDRKDVSFFNINTVDGVAESAYYDVLSTPTVIKFKERNDTRPFKEIKRWVGEIPNGR